MTSGARGEDMHGGSDLHHHILRQVCNLKMWRKGAETAPHKPILILYALTRCESGGSRMIGFVEIEQALTPLLKAVQRNRPVVEPRYPFWRLQSDGLWEVESDGPMLQRRGNTDPLRSELIAKNARGGFPTAIFNALASDAQFRARVSRLVLERYFSDAEQVDLRRLLGVS